jgi:hypothetical protein
MVLSLLESEHIGTVIAGLTRTNGFHLGMLCDAKAGETSGEFLTRLFGEGEWSHLQSPVGEIELEFARINGRRKRVQEITTVVLSETPAVICESELAG